MVNKPAYPMSVHLRCPVMGAGKGLRPLDPQKRQKAVARGKRTKERTGRIEIRCTLAERQAWEAEAAALGCSLSALIRQSLAKPQTACVADPALVRQAAAIGNNLNQLTRWANTYKEGIEARLVLVELQHIRRELLRLAEDASC